MRRDVIADGSRHENDAEHQWHVALMAVLLAEHAAEPADPLRVATMLMIHDLVEIDAGDVHTLDTDGRHAAAALEAAAETSSSRPSNRAARLCTGRRRRWWPRRSRTGSSRPDRVKLGRSACPQPAGPIDTRVEPARAGPGEESLMRYMFLLNTPEGGLGANIDGPEAEEMGRAWGEVMEKMGAAGVLIDCAPLTLPETATTVRVRNGHTLLSDGPAAEIKEWLGGYCLVNCIDLDDALRWAAQMPAASNASVEVRAVIDTARA